MPLTNLNELDAHMLTHSYVEGPMPTQKDISVFKAIAPPPASLPHAARWYAHIASFSASRIASLPGVFETMSSSSAAAPAPEGKPEGGKQEKKEKAPKEPKEKKEKAPKEEKKKEEKAEPSADEKAKAAAKDAEKRKQKIIKEGGKKGVEIEGASDMGGLDFFCTTMELPEGNIDELELSMLAMNGEPDPGAEDRKGCSGHIGKMIYSAGVEQLAMVAYVPDSEHNKSASKVDVTKWMDDVCSKVGASVTKKAFVTTSLIPDPKSGDLLSGTKGKISGKMVCAIAKSDPEKGKFALKDKDAAMAAAFAYLRSMGAFPEDNDDDSDDMVFGDDDNLDDYM